MTIIFEDGMYPSHDRKDADERTANMQWFANAWDLLNIGGRLVTDVGIYIKTDKGFRRDIENLV